MTTIVGINLMEEKLKAYDKGYNAARNEIKGRLLKVVEGIQIELNYAKSMGHKQAIVAYQNAIDALNYQIRFCE